MQIRDQVALVSGGASGLGEATARRIVAEGGRVVIADLNAEKGEALAAELGDAAIFVAADVADEGAVGAAVAAATELGTLRIAVNCAGIGWAQRTLARDGSPHTLEAFERVVRINLFGSFNVLRLAGSAMSQNEATAEGERGVIVNTASVAAYEGQIGQVAYAASKGAIVGMTLPAARDLAKVGIRVITIAPGVFDTPLLAMLPEAARTALGKSIPHPSRLGNVDEFAALAHAIITTPYINGETIRIDGALRMSPK